MFGTLRKWFESSYASLKQQLDDAVPIVLKKGSSHYKITVEPIVYILLNDLGFCEGNVVKYITRWQDKNGIDDLQKAVHYLEFLIWYHTMSQSEKEQMHSEIVSKFLALDSELQLMMETDVDADAIFRVINRQARKK